MGNGPDNLIAGLTFATIYNRVANLISINAGVLAIAQWAQAATEPHFRAWLGKTAQALPERFPGFPEENLAFRGDPRPDHFRISQERRVGCQCRGSCLRSHCNRLGDRRTAGNQRKGCSRTLANRPGGVQGNAGRTAANKSGRLHAQGAKPVSSATKGQELTCQDAVLVYDI